VRRMIECTNGLGHSLKAHKVVPGWSSGEGAGDVMRQTEVMERRGRGGNSEGERWSGRTNRMSAAKLTGGVDEGVRVTSSLVGNDGSSYAFEQAGNLPGFGRFWEPRSLQVLISLSL
jgi:hypothetical protein